MRCIFSYSNNEILDELGDGKRFKIHAIVYFLSSVFVFAAQISKQGD